MVIEKDKVAVVHYTLRKDGRDGEIIEVVAADSPMALVFGHNRLIPGFEANLLGLKAGDSFAFPIKMDQAYGPKDESAFVSLPIDTFKVNGIVDEKLLVLGNRIPMRDNYGNRHDGYVHEVSETTVLMDFNNPLAGHDIYFEGAIVEIRDALPEEITPKSQGCGSGGCGCSTGEEDHDHDHGHGGGGGCGSG
jgi:FKBP-type peptidyl-prolyl cis-trans isomerase SlyD